jgi:glutamate racemase
VEVVGHACPDLLHLAEQGEIMDRRRIQLLAKECINPLEREGIDALVLGCTDLTCIIGELQAVITPQIILIDPAQEVAKKADKVLRENGWRRSGEGHIKFFASGEGPRKIKDFAQRLFGIQFENITIVDYIT